MTRRAFMVGILGLLLLAVVASRFWPTIERIEVSGNAHHSTEDILRIADVAPGDPFLWVIRRRVAGLEADPWIRQAWVTRRWPDGVAIHVAERSPALRVGDVAYARDGTLLPGASEVEMAGAARVSGWGGDRFDEALALFRQLEPFQVKVLSYSPAGFAVELAHTQLFTPNLDALRANWASFVSQQGGRAYVYPWGVSAAHD